MVMQVEAKQCEEAVQSGVAPVYVYRSLVQDFLDVCAEFAPKETVGFLFGERLQWRGRRYAVVHRWVPGFGLSAERTGARLTALEISAIRNRIDGEEDDDDSLSLLGIAHSHPFGVVTDLSSTDNNTFLSFPYNYEGNVFMLGDPGIGMVRWYCIRKADAGNILDECDWVEVMDE